MQGRSRLKRTEKIVLVSGLSIRLALAPITGHIYDLALFAISQRLYYGQGIIDLKYFPTLPVVYYLQLPFYALYVLLLRFGLTDIQQLYRTTLMVEGVFLKLPFILSDIGGYFAIRAITKKTTSAMLYFLNPLIIYLSSVWGTYDTAMLFALLLGLYFFQRKEKVNASVALVIAGTIKLFGFAPYALTLLESLIKRRFIPLMSSLLVGLAAILVVFLPDLLFGSFRQILATSVFRFVGFGLVDLVVGVRNYNLVSLAVNGNAVVGYSLLSIPNYVGPLGLLAVLIGYFLEARNSSENFAVLVKWSLTSAVILTIFSISEPQWFSWVVPLGIVYGALTQRDGLEYFTYPFGIATTFVTMINRQGVGYMLGTATRVLPTLEFIPNGLRIYAITMLSLFGILLAYTFWKPVRFKLEILIAVLLIYLQAYFWFGIVKIV